MIQRGRFEMPVIRITEATWDRLKRWAVPLEDSPEDAIRKALGAAEEHLKFSKTTDGGRGGGSVTVFRRTKLRRGLKTPQEAYRQPILEAVYELGGSASVGDVLKVVKNRMKPVLKDVDYQKLPSGVDFRWRNTAMWERFSLVNEGLLKSGSPDGMWELSSKGIQQVKKTRASASERSTSV
jgi:hypothetical protein